MGVIVVIVGRPAVLEIGLALITPSETKKSSTFALMPSVFAKNIRDGVGAEQAVYRTVPTDPDGNWATKLAFESNDDIFEDKLSTATKPAEEFELLSQPIEQMLE